MRNVLKSGEVFHFFANKTQASGRCGNISFALPRAYSYAAVIGKHFPQGVALSNTRYSVTTSGHQSDLAYACRHLARVYVPAPDDVRTSYRQVQINIDLLLKQASTAKSRRDAYLADALEQIAHFNKFAEWSESDLRIDTPVADAETLKKIAASVKAETAKRNAAKKERARQIALDNAQKLDEWRNGGSIYLPYGLPVALRIKGEAIETSKGARIHVNDAFKLWPIVLRVMSGDKNYTPGEPLGVYRLTQIRTNGSIVVGCHDIAFSELENIARKLALI